MVIFILSYSHTPYSHSILSYSHMYIPVLLYPIQSFHNVIQPYIYPIFHTVIQFHTVMRMSFLQSDFANNEKFIALNIAPSDGNRLYLPEDFVVQGVKINTPHYLAKLEELTPGDSTFTVIVSQLDSLSTIHYTLRVRHTCVYVHVYGPDLKAGHADHLVTSFLETIFPMGPL